MRVHITKKYGEKIVLDHFDLEMEKGKVTCILGASGAGKTTLLRILAGLTDFEGSVQDLPSDVGFVFQEPRLLPCLTVEDNISYVGATAEETAKALAITEMSAHAQKYPAQLSGGEKQRVSLARAIAKKPRLLLLDEPFSSLDLPLKLRLLQVFQRLRAEYAPTVVFVTHDIDEALTVGDSAVVIGNGKKIFQTAYTPSAYGENVEIKRQMVRALTDEG